MENLRPWDGRVFKCTEYHVLRYFSRDVSMTFCIGVGGQRLHAFPVEGGNILDCYSLATMTWSAGCPGFGFDG